MTHVIRIDDRPKSLTQGMEIFTPATIIETTPMKVLGMRIYERTVYGERIVKPDEIADKEIYDVRILASTMPKVLSGVPKKKEELMEIEIGGGTPPERIEYARNLIEKKEIKTRDVFEEGQMIDVSAVTKGKGRQGPVKRWGVSIQSGKMKRSSKGRHIGNIGPWHPARVRWTVPQEGQTGCHQRTEYNKLILKIGRDGSEITSNGGLMNYGVVENDYVLLSGSVPGPKKSLIYMRAPIRSKHKIGTPGITYVSK
jgi:large subunit ribosomal protein L3